MPRPAVARGRLSGFALVMLATGIVGVAGYVITWLVPRVIGPIPYVSFAIFWSFAFLFAAALSGIQQEITRATRAMVPGANSGHRARNFGAFASIATGLLILSTSPLWVGKVFPDEGYSLVLPLAVGTASYVLLAVLTGSLYALAQWSLLFWVIIAEGLLRLLLIGVTLTFTSDPVPLAWAVAVPFPSTVIILWPFARGRLRGKTELDVGYGRLCWNVLRTIIAAGSMGLLVSGFPMLLGMTSVGESRNALGLLILAATLTRAPLIVVGMALQSYLIVLFRNHASTFWRTLFLLEGIVLLAGTALGALGWWLGPAVFMFLFPNQEAPAATLIAALVASSALVGALCVSAPALLSKANHFIFTSGWVAAAFVTVVCLVLPLPLVPRTLVSLTAGPVAGLLVHGLYLAASGFRSSGRAGRSESR